MQNIVATGLPGLLDKKKKPKTKKVTDLKPNPHHGENWGHRFARPCRIMLLEACQALEACKGLAQACQVLAATSGFRSLQPHRPTRPLSWHVGKVVGESSK